MIQETRRMEFIKKMQSVCETGGRGQSACRQYLCDAAGIGSRLLREFQSMKLANIGCGKLAHKEWIDLDLFLSRNPFASIN